jgi:O-antigen/teichoic acid export membrane protein
MDGARRVVVGARALFVSSFSVMLIQLGYASVTSRLIAPDAFGTYAVALSGVGLVGMLASAGFGQAAARADPDSGTDKYLASAALAIGLASAAVACLVAVPWSRLWSNPSAAPVMLVMSASIPFGAVLAVATGGLRRQGRTKTMAILTASGQMLGMAAGLFAVWLWRSPMALAVTPLAGSMFALTFAATALRLRLHWGRLPRQSHADLVFGLKSSGMSLLRFVAFASPSWSLSRFVGAEALGNYNRATSLIQAPAEGLQKAITAAIFPELRPGGPVFRRKGTFTEIVAIMTWATLIIGPLAMAASGPLIALALGPGWDAAVQIAPWAALAGILPFLSVPLMSAVEALARYRALVLGWLMLSVSIGIGVAITALTRTILPAPISVSVGEIAALIVYYWSCWHHGDLAGRTLARLCWPVIVVQVPLAAVLLALSATGLSDIVTLLLVSLVGLTELLLLWLLRRRIAIMQVLEGYGLLSKATLR